MDSNADQIEFQLLMQKEAKNFEAKAKLKEEKYGQTKLKFVDSSDKFDSFAPNDEEEEKNMLDPPESSDDTPPFTLKSQFLKNLESKDSLDKTKSQENCKNMSEFNEFTIKNLNTGESYDIRNADIVNSLTGQSKQLIEINKEKAWQDYW